QPRSLGTRRAFASCSDFGRASSIRVAAACRWSHATRVDLGFDWPCFRRPLAGGARGGRLVLSRIPSGTLLRSVLLDDERRRARPGGARAPEIREPPRPQL